MKKPALLIMLIISVQCLVAQPIIGIGKSKGFISSHMRSDPEWKLTHESKTELIYCNDSVIFTYQFMKDDPDRHNRTCTRCLADFPDSTALETYLNVKVQNWKLRPHPDMFSLIVVTDLYNDTINAVVVGNKRIVFSY
jgi:hypothetical protein